ncbi:MAG: divergent polysaccharide deacetylase family protein [Rickettsiales bacterium]|nr:divergent polysaccharide deacetylase family protein [Rickettsiales bacterium]
MAVKLPDVLKKLKELPKRISLPRSFKMPAHLDQWFPLPPLFWKGLLGFLAVAIIGSVVMLWLSGKHETEDAFASGRRLLVTLEDGVIAGNVIVSTAESAPKETASTEDTADKTTDKEPATADENAVETTDKKLADAPAETATATQEPEIPIAEEQVVATPPNQEVMEDLSDQELPAVPAGRMMADQNTSLTEKSKSGPVPVISNKGEKPWKYYAKPYAREGSKPMIAVIVTNLGHNKIVTENALRLPENITLSFSPYAPDILSWGKSARATGHEIVLDLPLQPSDYPITDPGPHGLILDKGSSYNEEQLQWIMSRLPVYNGFVTPSSEGFSSDTEAFKLLLQSISNRGLMMVLGHDPAKDETKELLNTTNVAHVIADLLIDEDLSVSSIQARFIQLEQLAKKRGFAVALAQPYPLTIQQLRQWSKTLEEKGILLVPISAIVKMRFS